MEVIFQILFFGRKIWRTLWSKYYGRESDDRNAVLKKCEIHFIFITQTDFSIPLTSKRWFFFHFLELDGRKFQKRKLAFYANPLTLRLELDQSTVLSDLARYHGELGVESTSTFWHLHMGWLFWILETCQNILYCHWIQKSILGPWNEQLFCHFLTKIFKTPIFEFMAEFWVWCGGKKWSINCGF